VELLKQKVSINEDDCMCQTYSTGSISNLKVLKSVVTTVCWMARSACGWKINGNDPVWSVSGDGNLHLEWKGTGLAFQG